jgi:hypothetical protein
MILSSYPFWWLALPVLLLPIWWHRQKRQRLKAEPLATARFLPSAAPEQLRVWRWRDRVLLLVRCLMLVALIAWLAATIFPWRGDTVLLDAGADKAWAEQQISGAGLSAAARIELPANALQWLREHERDWRADARLLIVARSDRVAMPARLPQFSHQVELRTKLGAAPAATKPSEHGVVLAASPERTGAWRSLFAAFDRAGDGAGRYTLGRRARARHGTDRLGYAECITASQLACAALVDRWPIHRFPELAKASTLTINGLTLKYADSSRGRLWTSDAFPPRDADSARALYETWQLLQAATALAYPAPSQTFAAARGLLPAIADVKPAAWLMLALLALFILERILTHARRN